MKKIKEILINKIEEQVSIKGWIISNRGNNKIRFFTINDGSTFENIQVIIKNPTEQDIKINLGSSVEIFGKLKKTPKNKQPVEIISEKINLLKKTDEDYPLQKKNMTKEFLREIPHLRHRTNLFKSVMRIRSTLVQSIHKFFDDENFLNVSSPIITSNDGEGAGESFIVDDENKEMFFNQKANLSVTGQLHAEAYSNGFGDVYTFGPTFRAEKSNTQKHAAEFWMLEPEMAFSDLNRGIEIADNLLKFVINKTFLKNELELKYLDKNISNGLIEKLNSFLKKGVQKIDYSEVIEKLKKVKDRFKEKKIEFGLDLATEHEKYIAKLFNGPVAVVNYPKEIKAFYMKQNEDNKTVAAFDILVPGIGELVGGSQRETNHSKIIKRIEELKIDKEDLEWYTNLRRFGQYESTGFGLGFERLVMYVTGIENIRDSIPFPRTYKNLKM